MTPDNVLHHKSVCEEIMSLYERKNHDYGNSFSKSYTEEGMAMARIRLSDKLNRFKALTTDCNTMRVNDESIRDTLIDLANYAIMTIMEIDNENPGSRAPGQEVCCVNVDGKMYRIMHNPAIGYYVGDDHTTMCQICKYFVVPNEIAPCGNCMHNGGEYERFVPKL